MQANELRIGNWVIYKTRAGRLASTVSSITDETAEYIEPIPLSPEILEKAGFSRFSSVCYQLILPNGVELVWNEGVGLHICYDGGSIGRAIHDLHNAQNAYYSLTGQELDFQP